MIQFDIALVPTESLMEKEEQSFSFEELLINVLI